MIRSRVAVVAGALLCAASEARAWYPSLMPSNQRISPAGRQISLGLSPSSMAMSEDGAFLLVTDTGFLGQSVTSVGTQTLTANSRQVLTGLNSVFEGIALSPDGRNGFFSGGAGDVVRLAQINSNGTVALRGTISVPGFPIGMAVSSDGSRLYVAQNLAQALAVADVASKTVLTSIPVGKSPWRVVLNPARDEAYVTNRGDRTVSIVDTTMNVVRASVPTGSNPNAIGVTPDGTKVFVANANSDDVTVFDTADPASPRTISLLPFSGANLGSSPSALTISPDGKNVYVALSWENAIAVIDPVNEILKGYIPTGFYPSAIAVSPDSRTLYIANMKGSRTYPRTPVTQMVDFVVNTTLGGVYGVSGTLSVLPVPDDAQLRGYTHRVIFNNGYDKGVRPSTLRHADGPCFPIPCKPDDVTPIKHVFFIVRENKTYDEVLGDLPEGDGDPNLTMFPRNVSPNTHALAEEFVLMDRLFANSEKSEEGHNWTMGAIDTDYGERTWVPVSNQLRPDDIGSHQSTATGQIIRGLVFPIGTPENGFWFDNCQAHGVSFRNYGEFLRTDENGNPIDYWAQNTNFDFPVFDLKISDVTRFNVWQQDFQQQVATGTVPQFTYIALPNDHGALLQSNLPTPEAYVADNDFALGKIVETITQASDVWQQSAIFVIEDDPQSGGDHVDSHRTLGLVISPYVRRHAVIHTRYDMGSMHRTMELILGLPPMSIFDQMAIPMRDVFTDTPDFTPYTALPQNVPFELNPPGTALAELSSRYDVTRRDRVPDSVASRILWAYFRAKHRVPTGR
jgi:YVTN family beta-propeller protein